MAKYGEKFNRVEKKYRTNRETFVRLLEMIRPFIVEDDYPRYTVYNIYYDTKDSRMIQNSLMKPVYKEKLRLRSYDITQDQVFIEMKKKFESTVFKRRIALTKQEASNYLDEGLDIENDTQIKRELDYLLAMYNPERKVFLSYDRIAFHALEDEEVRITFDCNIRYRFHNLILQNTDEDELILDEDEYLMEIKVQDTYPIWLSEALTKLRIWPSSFSKYGYIYEKNLAYQKEGGNQYV